MSALHIRNAEREETPTMKTRFVLTLRFVLSRLSRSLPSAFAALLLWSTWASSVVAADTSIRVGGRTLIVEPPLGYCVMDKRHPSDRRIVELLENGLASFGRFHYAFADCEQLADWRRGLRKYLDDYGYVANELAMEEKDLSDRTQAEINAGIRQTIDRYERPLMSLGDTIAQRAIEQSAVNVKQGEAKFLGVLEESSNGFFTAMLIPGLGEYGDKRTMAGVGNSVLVRNKLIFSWLYKSYQGSRSVLDALTTQKTWANDIIAANE
jgi:hypothetical protein